MAEKHDLTYTVLSDPGNQIASNWASCSRWARAPATAQAVLGVDLASVNADGTSELPLTTAVVVGADGAIRWIDVRPDYTERSEPAEIIAAVEALA